MSACTPEVALTAADDHVEPGASASLTLTVTDSADGNGHDHVDWGDAVITCAE